MGALVFRTSGRYGGLQSSNPLFFAGPEASELAWKDVGTIDLVRQSLEPIVVTTVDLLSTGVNIPALKNVVVAGPLCKDRSLCRALRRHGLAGRTCVTDRRGLAR
jgi:hypothetical protein